MVIWNELEGVRRRENARRGYVEVKTPLIFDKVLWERSGHWEKFRENMFLIPEGDQTFAIKPMNCPGHMLLFANTLRSYRELPLRYAEAAPLHRNERAGTLHGLTRVRHVTQDDAHIFCTREQIEDEIFGCLDYAKYLYDLFGLDASFELSTRPDNKLGTEEEWDFTEAALQAALDRRGLEYVLNPGDGAFYGPKIDLHMTDSLGRSWQMGTIQLDSQQPERLNCRYIGADNAEHTPYVVHRAFFGSFERFIGILDRALRRRVPVLARAGAGAGDPGRGAAPRGRARPGRRRSRATGSRSTTRGRPSASGSGTPRSRRSRSSSSTATRRAPRALRSGSGAASRAPSRWSNSGRNLLPWNPGKQGRNRLSPPSSRFGGSTECSIERVDREPLPLHASGFSIYEEVNTSLVKSI